MLPSGMNEASKIAASKVVWPEISLRSASPDVPWFVDVPEETFASPEELVMLDALPVDKITPVSEGVTPGAVASPSE